NYLGTVLRLKAGDGVLVFNGRDGEWRGTLATTGKRRLALAIGTRTRPQTAPLDLPYLFPPLKPARPPHLPHKAPAIRPSRRPPPAPRGRPRQPRAHAGECHRGRRAVRHHAAARDPRAADARAADRGIRSPPPARVLRRGGGGEGPGGRALAGTRCSRWAAD